jgi:ribosomal subunit interface protein
MSIEITVRHTEALGDVQEQAQRQAEALLTEFPSIEHIHVIMDVEKHRRHVAEVNVQGKRHIRFGAREMSNNMRQSLSAAMDKVSKQLRRLLEKVHDHKAAMKRSVAAKQRRVEETT